MNRSCSDPYNTHKDFGSGDRICYHGVLDMYREPKLAAYVYASQAKPEDQVILQPVTFWARGERNIGGVLPLIILTNCDYVDVKIGEITKRVHPDRKTYPHLPHPPCILDHNMVTPEEFGEWGMTWRDGEITGYIDGEKVKRLFLPADPLPTTLQIIPDDIKLRAGEKDTVRVILRVLDQGGNLMPFFDDPVSLTLEGPGRLVGPNLQSFKGGALGIFIEAGNVAGTLTLSVRSRPFGSQTIMLDVS